MLAVHCIALGIEQPNPYPCLLNSTAGGSCNGSLKLRSVYTPPHYYAGYLNYYDACVEGLKSVHPSLQIGTPGEACKTSVNSICMVSYT